MIRGLEELDGACGGHPCESWSEFAIVIVNEESGYLPIRRSLSQLLCDPCIGRSFRHTYMNHSPRFQLNDEERKERAEEEIGDLQKIAGPHLCHMDFVRACKGERVDGVYHLPSPLHAFLINPFLLSHPLFLTQHILLHFSG